MLSNEPSNHLLVFCGSSVSSEWRRTSSFVVLKERFSSFSSNPETDGFESAHATIRIQSACLNNYQLLDRIKIGFKPYLKPLKTGVITDLQRYPSIFYFRNNKYERYRHFSFLKSVKILIISFIVSAGNIKTFKSLYDKIPEQQE